MKHKQTPAKNEKDLPLANAARQFFDAAMIKPGVTHRTFIVPNAIADALDLAVRMELVGRKRLS